MPIPTDPRSLLHWNMVNVHQAFKLGLDNISKQLVSPPQSEKELRNFIGYCLAWCKSINSHHDSEEKIVFPLLNTKLDFSREAEQHQVIHAKLDTVDAYLSAALASRSPGNEFSAPKLKQMLDELRGPLVAHLDEEVADILPGKLEVFSDQELIDMDKALEKYVKANDDPFLVLPFMMGHTTTETKAEWPPFPWLLKKILIPYVFGMKHSG